jgi:hypothetical protein
MMTMDILLLDECGQLSLQQLSIMDVVLRHLRENNMPFGGVLIIGSFDHKQLGSVDGLPFLLNNHVISDFTVVRLEQSVRAAEDENLQVSLLGVSIGTFASFLRYPTIIFAEDPARNKGERLYLEEEQGDVSRIL